MSDHALKEHEIIAHVREFFSRPGAEFAFETTEDDDSGLCVYRGNQDPASPIRCAIGCILPDRLYRPEYEEKAARVLWDVLTGERVISAEVTPDFLTNLQQVHDDAATEEKSIAQFLSNLDEFESTFDA